jgi:hypothetical protein
LDRIENRGEKNARNSIDRGFGNGTFWCVA